MSTLTATVEPRLPLPPFEITAIFLKIEMNEATMANIAGPNLSSMFTIGSYLRQDVTKASFFLSSFNNKQMFLNHT